MQRRLTDVELKDVSKAEAEIRQLAVDGLIHFQDPLLQTLTRMLINGTTDGLQYVEPPLTDEDARARPWVMVRDRNDDKWCGPVLLVAATKERFSYLAILPDLSEANGWKFARRATPAEIAAAGLEVAE